MKGLHSVSGVVFNSVKGSIKEEVLILRASIQVRYFMYEDSILSGLRPAIYEVGELTTNIKHQVAEELLYVS